MENIWCIRPFVDVDTNGIFARPCCVFRPRDQIRLDGYFDNAELIQVRQTILDGGVPSQCTVCQNNEAVTDYSFRLVANGFDFKQEIKEKLTVDNRSIENLLIETGNVCNLKCLQCNSMSSHARGIEMYRLGLTQSKPLRRSNNINQLSDVDAKKITIVGGEPFFDKVTIEFLKTLPSIKNTSEILLDINTNLTGVTEDLIELLISNYKHVQIKGSIDGYRLSNDYIRYPSKWNQIQQAIDILNRYQQIDLCLTTSVSNLSLLHLPKLIQWGIDNNIRNHYFSIVNTPDELMAVKLPRSLKQYLLGKFLSLKNSLDPNWYNRTMKLIDVCVTICKNDHDYDLGFLKNYLTKHDQHRGTDFRLAFPELYSID